MAELKIGYATETAKDLAAFRPARRFAMGGAAPVGFQAGDTNLYRFVGNDATNEVDPTGLQGKSRYDFEFQNGTPEEKGLKDPKEVKFDGGEGEVKVWINATGRFLKFQDSPEVNYKDGIYISITATKGNVKDLHWLQFIYRERIDAKTGASVEVEYPTETHVQGKAVKRWNKTGKQNVHLDVAGTVDGNVAYYDEPYSVAKVRTDTTLGIYDAPTPNHDADYKETSFVAESFLVDDKAKRVLYVVNWSIVSTKKTDGTWDDKMSATGQRVDRLPEYITNFPQGGKILLAGARKPGGKEEDQIKILNPFRGGNVRGIKE
jgi:hypothetical protein